MIILITRKPTFNFFLMFLFIFERETETEHEQGRGRERETETESEAGSRLWAVSTEPDTRLKLRSQRSWPELKSDA